MSEPYLKQVTFEEMLGRDEMIVCDYWVLNNSINKYGVSFKEPMLFSDFLFLIGKHLSSMNCKSLFKNAKWYVWTCD